MKGKITNTTCNIVDNTQINAIQLEYEIGKIQNNMEAIGQPYKQLLDNKKNVVKSLQNKLNNIEMHINLLSMMDVDFEKIVKQYNRAMKQIQHLKQLVPNDVDNMDEDKVIIILQFK